MVQALLVFLGGGLGAMARWAFGLVVSRQLGSDWPWATLGVNIIGSFAMGAVMGFVLKNGMVSPTLENWRLFLATGILGGFTTFSAFSFESARMIEAGNWLHAGLYSVTSVGLSVGALFAGMVLARLNG